MEVAREGERMNAALDVERECKEEGSDEELEQQTAAPIVPEVTTSGEEQGCQEAEASDEGEESEEEEILVVLELCDFKNHPVLGEYASLTLEVRASDLYRCMIPASQADGAVVNNLLAGH